MNAMDELITRRCTCCSHVFENGASRYRPAVARWIGPPPNSAVDLLCQSCLDIWLDNADDDTFLEPTNVIWLDPILQGRKMISRG